RSGPELHRIAAIRQTIDHLIGIDTIRRRFPMRSVSRTSAPCALRIRRGLTPVVAPLRPARWRLGIERVVVEARVFHPIARRREGQLVERGITVSDITASQSEDDRHQPRPNRYPSQCHGSLLGVSLTVRPFVVTNHTPESPHCTNRCQDSSTNPYRLGPLTF